MRRSWRLCCEGCSMTLKNGGVSARQVNKSSNRIAAASRVCSLSWTLGWRTLRQQGVDSLQALFGQNAGRLLQLDDVDHVVITAARIVGLRLNPLLPGLQHV